MPFQFIKQLLPLPSFFTLSMPSEEEPNVFLATVGPYEAPCPVCKGKTVRHAQTLRRFRHGYAWHVGLIWIELPIPRHRCVDCDLTFTHDFGLSSFNPHLLFFEESWSDAATGVLSPTCRVNMACLTQRLSAGFTPMLRNR